MIGSIAKWLNVEKLDLNLKCDSYNQLLEEWYVISFCVKI